MNENIKWEDDLKRYEIFSNTEIPPNAYFVVRVDGRAFHTEVKRMKMIRPFDITLRNAIINATKSVMADFGAILAYTESDEVSFLFPKEYAGYCRRNEKIVSLIAAKMSVCFAKEKLISETELIPVFDGRVVVLSSKEDVLRYFRWRMLDSRRNCISTYCFWTLVNAGYKNKKAQHELMNIKDSVKIKILKDYDIDYKKVAMEVINKFAEASDKGIIIFIGNVKCNDFFKQLRKEYRGD